VVDLVSALQASLNSQGNPKSERSPRKTTKRQKKAA
jgi:non-homologous end joining protein Ku